MLALHCIECRGKQHPEERAVKKNDAIISNCGNYRYALRREIEDGGNGALCFICLNPSKADRDKNDPTVRSCIRFARCLGYGDLYMVNLFACRSTDKKVLLDDPELRVGPCCDHYIDKYISACDMTIAAWGNFVSRRKLFWRAKEITDRHENLKALGITKKGHPHHPLYMPCDIEPVDFAGY